MKFDITIKQAEQQPQMLTNVEPFMLRSSVRDVIYRLEHDDDFPDIVVIEINRRVWRPRREWNVA